MELVTAKHIESVPEKCGGKPCIAGTRVRVWDIYIAHEVRGESPDQITAQYPSITLADVHAALAFYWDNREAIDLQMKATDEYVAKMKVVTGPGPLARKLANGDADSDTVSS